jgi:ABC-type nickel/cobalt efflux system permease component RcnA
MTHDPDPESGHDPAELHHPGDVEDEPHGLDDHGEEHGHDDHAHGSEELGPVDTSLWAAFAGGIVLGLIPALGILLAIQ